jgi:hypothetical protein
MADPKIEGDPSGSPSFPFVRDGSPGRSGCPWGDVDAPSPVITGTVRNEEQMLDYLGQKRAKRSRRTQGGDTDHCCVMSAISTSARAGGFPPVGPLTGSEMIVGESEATPPRSTKPVMIEEPSSSHCRRAIGQLRGFMNPSLDFHDQDTHLHELVRHVAASGGVTTATCLLKGFMICRTGVHEGRTGDRAPGPSPIRPPSPCQRRTSFDPTAAERRPECEVVRRTVRHSLSSTRWETHMTWTEGRELCVVSRAGTQLTCQGGDVTSPPANRTGKNYSEPAGLTFQSPCAPIMITHRTHEAESKMDDPLCGSWGSCRWPCPRVVPEVPSVSLRWAK